MVKRAAPLLLEVRACSFQAKEQELVVRPCSILAQEKDLLHLSTTDLVSLVSRVSIKHNPKVEVGQSQLCHYFSFYRRVSWIKSRIGNTLICCL